MLQGGDHSPVKLMENTFLFFSFFTTQAVHLAVSGLLRANSGARSPPKATDQSILTRNDRTVRENVMYGFLWVFFSLKHNY